VILLIEDDLVTCHIMTALLKRVRQPHVVAHDGAEALEHVARQPIDLIIADLMLPDMNGLDLIEQILVRPHLQDIPVMFCTANADPKTVERALALGAVDFVKKPIVVDAFAGRIDRALKRAPARWESRRAVIRRLHVDSRAFEPLLALARDALAGLVAVLAALRDGLAHIDEVAAQALTARVVGVRSAALNVGAVRAVQLIDFLWSGSATDADVRDLHAALVIELGVMEQALQRRASAA
jgi:putative two-component system response regulator